MKMKQLEKIVLNFFEELSHLAPDIHEESCSVAAIDEITDAAAKARNEIQEILEKERLREVEKNFGKTDGE